MSRESLHVYTLEKLARTDASAMVAYEDRVRDFHEELRQFHYPLLFREVEYDADRLRDLPRYDR